MKSFMEEFEAAISAAPNGNVRFFEQHHFPWIDKIEAKWPLIKAEAARLLSAIELLPGFEEIQHEQSELTNDRHWQIFPFYVYGQTFERNLLRCPESSAALKDIVGLKAAMFSVLRAGKVLPLHRGPYKGVLRYHLGIIIPTPETQCAIEVAGEIEHWGEGKSLVFDDSYEHSAWNYASEDRIVLFVDFIRPLPWELAIVNEQIINQIQDSSFIVDTLINWNRWERAYGKQLDSALGIIS
ncbi:MULTISPECIES: aspartyl/asparaginyl beta-hydroxylase domain-containing protein [Pseudomonas syringae group]|uniref:Aspartyl/asparaginyl beta-hydroxylase n=1 Tax=Pseudomonas syringae pv. coryli TaxID=317659 RepID=A0A0P9NKA0_9PSED|nr:aspartyl/asparaginyl beta-hydroxylase domain-containing protein [Pseudomonas syringae pv. coryli]KPX05297.1 Aspartyl/asparaginyl beta-hydroxylase [Pseudomonas syringae pv. coryli]